MPPDRRYNDFLKKHEKSLFCMLFKHPRNPKTFKKEKNPKTKNHPP
jgi:hypothetical protein